MDKGEDVMCIRLKNPRKLDTKWKYLNSGVFENIYGDRIHLGGRMVKMKDSTPFTVHDDVVFRKCEKVMSGVKRGLMLYTEYYREVQVS